MVSAIILLILNIMYFLVFNIQGLFVMLLMCLFTYVVAKLLEKRKQKVLIFGYIVIILLGWIGIETYNAGELFAVLGLSYTMLRCIGYVVDVYWDRYKAETNIIVLGAYILFFPVIPMGPITRFDRMKVEFLRKRNISFEKCVDGLFRIIKGLFKKLVIADRIALVVNYTVQGEYEGVIVLITLLLYSIQLYCDFAGGIDVALGVCKIMDINAPENFNYPYLAQNLSKFWQRWHITLGAWFKEYVFYPLSINKDVKKIFGKKSIYIALMVTWALTGLWHGFELRFLVWGLLNGVVIVVERISGKDKKTYKGIRAAGNIVGTFVLVSVLRVFDLYESVFLCVNRLFSFISVGLGDLSPVGVISLVQWIMLLLGLVYMFMLDKIGRKNSYIKMIFIAATLLMVIVFGIYGIEYEATKFIYSNY